MRAKLESEEKENLSDDLDNCTGSIEKLEMQAMNVKLTTETIMKNGNTRRLSEAQAELCAVPNAGMRKRL